MTFRNLQYSSLNHLLCYRSERCTGKKKIDFLNDSGTVKAQLSFAELDKNARSIADELFQGGFNGRHIIVLAPPGPEYIEALFGCLYAGAIPVPADPPMGGRDLQRFINIIQDCDAPLILTTHLLVDLIDSWIKGINNQVLACIAIEELVNLGDEAFEPISVQCNDIALLQYTSGTTGKPKGVMVSHECLLQNVRQIIHAFSGITDVRALETDVLQQLFGTVSWLPPYHDMGLIGGVLSPIYAGTQVTLMSPITFLKNPYLWLKTISERKALISGAPNFAYDYCVKKVSEKQKADLDLSSWRLAFNAAEPINAVSMEKFIAHFSTCGFNPSAFLPCYGLAEATLLVSGATPETGYTTLSVSEEALKSGQFDPKEEQSNTKVLVSSGTIVESNRVEIVDPITLQRLDKGRIGEIWIQGPSVCAGYWGKPGYSLSIFSAQITGEETAGRFLRSGDLGFIHQGELYITGRMKELIIIDGRNFYPQDLEFSLQSKLPSFRKGCGATFTVEGGTGERLLMIQEFDGAEFGKKTLLDLCLQARSILACDHGIDIAEILLIRVGDLAKTSSGKIQRAEMKKRYLEDEIETLFHWREGFQCNNLSSINPTWPEKEDTLLTEFKLWIAEYLDLPEDQIDLNNSFFALGIESSVALELIYELEEVIERRISSYELQQSETVLELMRHLCEGLSKREL